MTVSPDDYRWRTLTPVRMRWLALVNPMRQDNAEQRGRWPGPGVPTDPIGALLISSSGLLGECAVMIFVSPCKAKAAV
jgi:hypothetical protein